MISNTNVSKARDVGSDLWTVCKPSIILCVVLLILEKVFPIRKEPDYLWFILQEVSSPLSNDFYEPFL